MYDGGDDDDDDITCAVRLLFALALMKLPLR